MSISELARALAAATGRPESLVSYEPDEAVEAVFGRYPPLTTEAADAAGFHHDGDVGALVKTILAELD